MKKESVILYPEDRQERDLNSALISMLNSIRYLENNGFIEYFKPNNSSYTFNDFDDLNSIGGGFGKIELQDGSFVSHRDFVNSKNRSSLIERMISDVVIFSGNNNLIIKSIHEKNQYTLELSILRFDTKIDKLGFWKGFLQPEFIRYDKYTTYTNRIGIQLEKEIINCTDIEEFERYKHELEEVIRQPKILTFKSGVTKSPTYEKVDIPVMKENKGREVNIVNPWDVEVDKIEQFVFRERK